MKKNLKTMLGVTLLEIMLVLAIAALVIVMSIRFYQSASTSNKVNAGMSTIQGIVAAGENYLLSSGTASTTKITSGILPYLPGGVMPNSPWGGVTKVAGTDEGKYTITMNAPGAAPSGSLPVAGSPCSQLQLQLNQNSKFKALCDGKQISVEVTT